MAEVYKFKVKLNEFEDYLWRDIEITSVSSIAKLSYAVLAVFDAKATHLFCIESNENHYEFMFDGFEDFGDFNQSGRNKIVTVKIKNRRLPYNGL